MGMTGERRRKVWRWAVTVWALAVAVGGGLTLWLQDAAEPDGPYGWEVTQSPEPLPDGRELASLCPSDGVADDGTLVVCAYATIR
jgi:hypothetical protein